MFLRPRMPSSLFSTGGGSGDDGDAAEGDACRRLSSTTMTASDAPGTFCNGVCFVCTAAALSAACMAPRTRPRATEPSSALARCCCTRSCAVMPPAGEIGGRRRRDLSLVGVKRRRVVRELDGVVGVRLPADVNDDILNGLLCADAGGGGVRPSLAADGVCNVLLGLYPSRRRFRLRPDEDGVRIPSPSPTAAEGEDNTTSGDWTGLDSSSMSDSMETKLSSSIVLQSSK